MAFSMLPGLASLPWTRCRRSGLHLFAAGAPGGICSNPLYNYCLQLANRRHIPVSTRNFCISMSSTADTTPATAKPEAEPATKDSSKKFTLPPLPEEDENENEIIPPPVEYPLPIEFPPHRIDKPVTLIAGASRGLGLEFTRQVLAKYPEGPVIATCRNPDSAADLLALRDQYPERLTIMKLDVTDENTVKVVARDIYDNYGRLDLYINTVGVLHIPDVMTPERKIEQVQRDSIMLAFQINAVGPAVVAKHLLPLLKFGQGEGTGRKGAVLVHLSAKVGSINDNKLGGWYAYRASKAGLNQLTRTIGVECLRLKLPVIVALLHPGTVDTDLSKPFSRNVPPEQLFTPTVSVEKMLNVIDSLEPKDCAKFFAYDRTELPW